MITAYHTHLRYMACIELNLRAYALTLRCNKCHTSLAPEIQRLYVLICIHLIIMLLFLCQEPTNDGSEDLVSEKKSIKKFTAAKSDRTVRVC